MLLNRERLARTLVTVLHCVERQGPFRYCLIGTAAGLLQGVPLLPADIDLLAHDRADVDRFADALQAFDCRTPPTWMPAAGQYYAAFDVDGVKVEASTVEWPTSSPCLETIGAGPWTHAVPVPLGDAIVPAIALELRLATELHRGRGDRADAIIGWLRSHGCDQALLHCALQAQAIAADTQAAVLGAIRS